MSIPVVVWVFEHSEEKLGNRLVLLALAEFAHDDGSDSYPSIDTLTRRTRLSERQVRYCLRALEKSGAIVKEGVSQKRTTKYRILMLEGADSAGGQSLQGAKSYRGGGSPLPPTLKDPSCSEEAKASSSQQNGNSAPKPRERDVLWEALTAEFGEPLTANERKRLNGVCKELRGANALPEQVAQAARAWASEFPDATLTDTALAKHWTRLVRRVERSAPGARLLAAARARGHA